MIADVPIGAFLSGGVDSTLMVSLMQSLSDKPIRTFTVGFEDEQYSEAKYALESAKHLGTMHTDFIIGYEDVMHLLGDVPKIFGEPFADSSQIPTMLVSKLAKEKVTVALSGDGGDEFFCGYNIYKNVAQAQKLDVMGGIVNGIYSATHLKDTALYNKLPFNHYLILNNCIIFINLKNVLSC